MMIRAEYFIQELIEYYCRKFVQEHYIEDKYAFLGCQLDEF
jgi:hypothetical protein